MSKGKRAALYLRVSTDGQTTNNQRQALTEVAERCGWTVTTTYEDAGISGAKGRDKRTFNVNNVNRRLTNLLAWIGRSKPDVVCLQELK